MSFPFLIPLLLFLYGGRVAGVIGETYRVPYRLTETSHILVRAKIDGVGPFNFIMDTGAPAVYLAPKAAEQCHITPSKDGWGRLPMLEIEGGARMEKIRARIEEPPQLTGMNAIGIESTHIDGVVGYNLLSCFRIQLDLTRSKMVWTRLSDKPEEPEGVGSLADKMSQEQAAMLKRAQSGVKQMEGLTKLASALFSRSGPIPTIPRGFFGMVLANNKPGVRIVRLLSVGGVLSPAAKAGLKPWDWVLRVAVGQDEVKEIERVSDVLQAVDKVEAGDRVTFVVRRGVKRLKFTVVAGKGGL